MQLVKPDDPILHFPCRADFTVKMQDIMKMFEILQLMKGLGLAAPQVGIDARLFITYWGEVFVNPTVVGISYSIKSSESCLSLPGVFKDKQRSYRIQLADGRIYTNEKAIVIQHEMDHLNGILITD
jgi:peptide deformylase